MKKKYKIIISILSIYILLSVYAYYAYKSSIGEWEIEARGKTDISWVNFIWTKGTLSGRQYDKTAMYIPSKMAGLDNILTFQFDLGSNRSMFYENKLSSFYFQNKELSERVSKMKFPMNIFARDKRVFQNASIEFGDFTISNKNAFVYTNLGKKISEKDVIAGDTIHMGTIGVDIFKNKVLIIDYPNQKFAICDKVPQEFKIDMFKIELDGDGRPVLPLKLNSKTYRISFDNGSSLFPILTSSEKINNFSTNPIIDSLEISSWGKKHTVHGRIITDTFEIAGRQFSNVKVFENHTGYGINKSTDGITGNALFWDSTIIIDFKNKKFGVKQ